MKEKESENHSLYDILNFHDQNLTLPGRYLSSWPSDGDLAYTMTSATSKSVGKKLSRPN